jgi:aminomuconate-semialdehyde/2-hydroxymuconate-6-semialdehyde dehydrogenase
MPVKITNYIHGQFSDALSGSKLNVYQPATGKVYATAPASDTKDVNLAVKAATEAFALWQTQGIDQRAAWLEKIADGIESRFDEFVEAESLDTGKPLGLAGKVDIPRAIANFRFFARAVTQFYSETHDNYPVALNYTLRQPLGVVACISPWNLPLYLLSWKIAPALAAANTVVAKPSEITPMTAYLLSEVCHEIGLPPGVLNIVHGYGHEAGNAINHHHDIKAISFTGSTRVGSEIARIAAPKFKKLSLEMGGKNPTIIFDDCDYDKMMKTVIRSAFTNQGQICLCGSRILVHSSLYDQFIADFTNETLKMKPGDPSNPNTHLGAVSSEAHLEKILSYFEIAKQEGGTILCGGERVILEGELSGGYFVAPTVVTGLDMQCRFNTEEVFGPVVSVMPFHTEAEAIAMANATQYGLSASIWTENLPRIQRVSRAVEAGIVWVNTWMMRDLRTPFGGVKDSGVGREGGFEALRFFTEAKNVCIPY